ncbi:transposase [Marinomonas primoryensis]|uniref:Transposase n=1 Tax=Marinomonas primoryensis TaxID=178399 RepID=A0A2Z4PU96_9GAMM|nr:transposase [Marinomonas primoryensis]
MSHQLTFTDSEFNNKRRKTRKVIFLSRMNELIPWAQLKAIIQPFYPKAGNGISYQPMLHSLHATLVQHE